MPREEVGEDLDKQRVAAEEAHAARQRGDWTAAAAQWMSYCRRFDDDASGFLFASEALMQLSRIDEAEEVLASGLLRHPDDNALRSTYARVAERRSDWAGALTRWQTLLDRRADDPSAYAGVGRAMSQLAQAQLIEADEVVRNGVALYPKNPDVLGTYARLAVARRDWVEALARWQLCLERLGDDPISHMSVGAVLRELRRLDDADTLLQAAVDKFPAHPGLLAEFARVAAERRDLPEALKRWTTFRDCFPNDPRGHDAVRAISSELGHPAEIASDIDEASPSLAPDKQLTELFLRFESLGDSAEFGMVQWHFGANPLGLLRFASVPPASLCAALQAKFFGLGAPETTVLAAERGEWIARDTRCNLAMHTFLREGTANRERTLALMCRRLQYLRDKLLADLSAAQKHLVYASREKLGDDEVLPLWCALRDYGNNRLLLVRPADDAHPPGMLRRIEDGLIFGYIDRLSVENPSFDLWLQICREADAIWSSAAEFGELIEPVEYNQLVDVDMTVDSAHA
jgi:Flp pilus assembly protein TadD